MGFSSTPHMKPPTTETELLPATTLKAVTGSLRPVKLKNEESKVPPPQEIAGLIKGLIINHWFPLIRPFLGCYFLGGGGGLEGGTLGSHDIFRGANSVAVFPNQTSSHYGFPWDESGIFTDP